MPTREIPRREWPAFLDSFSRQHAGWLATVEVLGAEVGAQVEVREQPLAGITADLREGDRAVISIFVGGDRDAHVAQLIHAPSHVRLKETEDGAHEALHIEAEGGTTTLLRFRSTVSLEALDGLVMK